jgi:hypothetical protein
MANLKPALPLPLLVSLLLLIAFCIIGGSVGINALNKFHVEVHRLRKAAPQGSSVNVNANDALDAGYNSTVMCGLIGVLAFLTLFPAISGRYLRTLSCLIGFFTVWLFASLVAFTVIFANRSAQVAASLGGIPIPDSLVQTIIAGLGATTRYKDINYREPFLNSPFLPMFFSRSFLVRMRSESQAGWTSPRC